jgi:hypothetical protein
MDLHDAADAIATDFDMAIRAFGLADGRSLQSQAGIIGPSDLGFCRQKAALMTRGVEQSDAKSIWPAQVGTAIHKYVGDALRVMHPDWVIDDTRVTAVFPSGFEVSGTPDVMGIMAVLGRGFYAVLDVKTKDGLAEARKQGSTQNHRYQRHTYALGAKQAGLVPQDHALLVGNVFVDRSGSDENVHVDLEYFDDLLTTEVDEWLQDVRYAVMHNEDAQRDVAAPVCEVICEYFTACRGNLPMTDAEPLRDPQIMKWIDLYVEGRDMEKAGEAQKKEAAKLLRGMNGTDGRYSLRTIEVAEVYQEGYMKRGHVRLDVRKVKGT